jgi:hypothetical protein
MSKAWYFVAGFVFGGVFWFLVTLAIVYYA